MQTSGLDWIDDLPPELAGQQALLRGLLALCDADDRIRWLVIGCSLARGAGDRLSDLDMAMGIRDEDFDAARPGLRRAVDGLGELIERVSRAPWRTWTPGGCWTRGGGSPNC